MPPHPDRELRPIRASDIAARVSGELRGDPDRIVARIATLAEADGECLSWLGDAKYANQLAQTRARVILVPAGVETPAGATAILVPDPDFALIGALELLADPIERPAAGVDPTAVISPGVQIDPTAAIGPHCSVGARSIVGPGTVLHPGVRIGHDVRLGRDCEIWNNVVIRERSTLGDRVIIHPNATIGADGFGYLFRQGRHVHIPQIGAVEIGDDVEIGAGTTIDRGRSGPTRIGKGVKIDNLVQVGHNCVIGDHCVIVAQCGISGSTTLGNYVVLAGGVGVADHVHIGDQVQVAAMSGVSTDVAPGKIVRGVPVVDQSSFVRQQASLRRLPKLIEQMRELAKRIERLEATHHRP